MTEMPVESGLIVVFVEKLADVAKVAAHLFRSYGGIVPAFPFRRRSRRRRCRARPGFAYLPDPLGLTFAVKTNIRRSRGVSEPIGKLQGERLCLIWIIASKFPQQDSPSFRKQFEIGRAFLAQPVDDAPFESFEANRTKFENRGHLFGSNENVRVAQSDQGPVLRAVNQPKLGFEHGDASAFTADERPRHMESVLRQKLIQVVAGDAPGNFWIPRADELAVLVANCSQLCVDL